MRFYTLSVTLWSLPCLWFCLDTRPDRSTWYSCTYTHSHTHTGTNHTLSHSHTRTHACNIKGTTHSLTSTPSKRTLIQYAAQLKRVRENCKQPRSHSSAVSGLWSYSRVIELFCFCSRQWTSTQTPEPLFVVRFSFSLFQCVSRLSCVSCAFLFDFGLFPSSNFSTIKGKLKRMNQISVKRKSQLRFNGNECNYQDNLIFGI